jgi:hypothetical protein
MKHLAYLVAFSALLLVACADDNPLDVTSETRLDDVNPIPHQPKSAPFFATWNTLAVPPPALDCDPLPGVDPFGIIGEGQVTHLGASTLVAISYSDPGPPIHQTTCSIITADNGDELWFETDGTGFQQGPFVGFWGDFVITGGTGRFGSATGGGTYEGTFDFTIPAGQFTMEGTISR